MTPHYRFTELARRGREPLYIVAILYVAVGLLLGAYGAVMGDRLAALIGFLFISGALCATLFFHLIARLSARMTAIAESLDELRTLITRVEDCIADVRGDGPLDDTRDAALIDLGAVAPPDPSALSAASLEHNRFPRLVSSTSGTHDVREPKELLISNTSMHWTPPFPKSDEGGAHDDAAPYAASTFCGRETSPDTQLDGRSTQATDRARSELRRRFAERVRLGDYAAALEVGGQIAQLFPGETIAAEFERLRPHLLRRLNLAAPSSAATLATS